jgi:putative ABC transport system substrate-binding protein
MMDRRAFVTGLGSAAAIWPLPARAQQPALPVIGYLGSGSRPEAPPFVGALHRGLEEMGFVEGQNVVIEYRWAEGRYQRIPALAAELVHRRVAVICAPSNAAALAAKAATSDIPIVFLVSLAPIHMGLVTAFNRPGGNATGVYFFSSALEPKRLELLQQLLPRVTSVAALVNPDNPNADSHTKNLQAAARTLGLQLIILRAGNVADIDTAFATLRQKRADALVVTSDPLFDGQGQWLVDLATLDAIPPIYPWREFADAGGLMSYGNSLTDADRQVGLYAGRVLKGDKPADLPVWQPHKFEFVFNLRSARTLGLTVPPIVLMRADEVIE